MREYTEYCLKWSENKSDAYQLGVLASCERRQDIVDRAMQTLSGSILAEFELGLMFQDSKHAA